MEVAERIRSRGEQLTSAERRIAEVILAAPQSVGFGTVAQLADAASVGAASVVRFAAKIGYDGYTELQQSVQRDLLQQLRPAAERIRTAASSGRAEHAENEISNIQTTLATIDDDDLASLVDRLADLHRPVVLIASDASRGVAQQLVSQLEQLRSGVSSVFGSDVRVQRELAVADPAATVLVIDLRRYEQWVLDAHATVTERGMWSAAVTDSVLSPLASKADVALIASAGSNGPFDSFVGVLSLLNLVAGEVAARLKETAAHRLSAIESAWGRSGSLTTGDA